jgi:hypothetical protein
MRVHATLMDLMIEVWIVDMEFSWNPTQFV